MASSQSICSVVIVPSCAFGPRRLLLGSDWPTCLLAGRYSDAIDAVRYLLAELPGHEQDEIRGGSAMRVYGLTDGHG